MTRRIDILPAMRNVPALERDVFPFRIVAVAMLRTGMSSWNPRTLLIGSSDSEFADHLGAGGLPLTCVRPSGVAA